jgi:two-component system, NtrC family, nitrogen regulation sensor histidine kinase NtrY
MSFKNFRLNIIVRIFILTATILVFLIILRKQYYITPFLLGLVMVFQLYSLFSYIDKSNRDLNNFLDSIRFSEFTRTFKSEGLGSSYDELNKAFNEVIKDFQQVRSEKEEHFQYLQSVVQNIDVGIIAYQRDGTIEMINKAAKKLFQVSTLKNIHALKSLSAELVGKLIKIQAGDSALVKVQDEEDILHLSIFATEFRIKEKSIILTTIKNIQSVLEEQETLAWQKLIRVLTHEIMNSITPIASLSSTLESMLVDIRQGQDAMANNAIIEKETVLEIQQALQTINKRSTGLLHFVQTYRNLTKIPKPNFRNASVGNLFSNISHFMEEDLQKSGVAMSVLIDPKEIEFWADEDLIEQVLINLVKNSIQALENCKEPMIQLRGFYNKRGRVTIQVADNGCGIIQDVLDKIFIPFFTTKVNGSGIGLSLSRQIMRLHNGTISAQSKPDEETIFTLTF